MTAGVLFVFLWRSDLCTPTCPYRLAWLGTSLRVRGKLTLRKKEIIVFSIYISFWRYPLPDSSLFIITCFLCFTFFMYACHGPRMTAGVNCVSANGSSCLSCYFWIRWRFGKRERHSYCFYMFIYLFFACMRVYIQIFHNTSTDLNVSISFGILNASNLNEWGTTVWIYDRLFPS